MCQLAFAVLITMTMLSMQSRANISLSLQDEAQTYKVGEKVEYWNHYTDKWEEGTIIKVYPEYNQVVIRQKPDQFFPKGEEKAFSMKDVRHIQAHQANEPPPDRDKNAPADERATGAGKKAEADKLTVPDVAGGQGLMTREEIINYLRARLPNGTDAANAEEVRRQLIEEIKRRGVNFHEKSPGEIYTVGGYSVKNNIPDAINSNLGAPVSQDWLMGTWTMYVYGLNNKYVELNSGRVITRDAVAKLDFLTINPDGTYIWKVEPTDPPAKYVKGTWRKATKEEMGLQGSAGIVLQKAAEGADWIVMKYMSPNVKTDNIEVEHIQYRGAYRRVGERRR
jgi:hypothetical protein